MPAPLRRSSSDPSLVAPSPPAPHRPAGTLPSLIQRHFGRPTLRNRRAPPHPAVIRPELVPPAQPHVPPPPPNPDSLFDSTALPFARRNLQLKFLQCCSSPSSFVERHLTRHQILADVRQTCAVATGERRHVRRFVHPPPTASPRNKRSIPSSSPPPRRARSRARGTSSAAQRHAAAPDTTNPTFTRHPRVPAASPPPEPWNARRAPASTDRRARQTTAANKLSVRDMRQIDPSFTPKPAIWVREEALVVSLESVRAIILSDRMYLFDPDNDSVKDAVWHIEKRLAHNIEHFFLPFEFRALEGILIHTCIKLERDFLAIEPELRRTLRDLPTRISNELLERLRHLEQRLNYYYVRARKVQQAIQAVLDEDEDMADMYLTEKRKNPGLLRNPMDHDEVEMLLETYLQMADDLTSRAELLNQAIDDTENLIEIHLDTMQNRVLLVDLIITAFSTTMSFGSMITSIFGMNLPLPEWLSRMPGSHYSFWACVSFILVCMGVGLTFLTRWCRRQGLYARKPASSRWSGRVPGTTQTTHELPVQHDDRFGSNVELLSKSTRIERETADDNHSWDERDHGWS